MKVGAKTRIGVILPGSRALEGVRLSRRAKLRLAWMDHYARHGSAAKTCRYYGIGRTTFYKWLKRYKPGYILSLEERSRAPKNKRRPTTPLETVSLVKRLRLKNPEYSKYKLSVIAGRDFGVEISPSTIARIISRYDLFRTRDPKRCRRRRRKGPPKLIKPKGLKASGPGQVFEFDAKHIRSYLGRKLYAFVTVDTFTRQTSITVSSSISSKQAAAAWEKAVKRLGRPEIVVTDHGSENHGEFLRRLSLSPTAHLFARVRQPKDKAFVERVIGSFEAECLSLRGRADTVEEQQRIADVWLAKYHYYRPHAALNYLTPHEFARTMETAEVSTML